MRQFRLWITAVVAPTGVVFAAAVKGVNDRTDEDRIALPAIKVKPETWKDLFFPIAYTQQGS